MSLSEAVCNKCSYTERFSNTLRTYELGGDQKLNIQQTFAWCPTCNRVVWAEKMPDLSQIEANLQEVIEWQRSDPDETLIESFERYVQQERLRMVWREARISPSRCLECGNTLITLASEHENLETESEYYCLPHIGCGGTITIKGIGLSLNRMWIFYTPEGDRIASYTVSPSKGLVPIKE